MELSRIHITRWATSDGDLSVKAQEDSSVTFKRNDIEVKATVSNGFASITLDDALKLMPDLGTYAISAGGIIYAVERVSNHYTTRESIIEYGRPNNDGFEDERAYPLHMVDEAIQRAEESIDNACGRSFCTRKKKARLFPGKITELPVVDVIDIECDILGVKLVSYCQVEGVTAATMATITYGLETTAQISEATTRLAASYLRPRTTAENARGSSVDGVYTSYTLATGEEGSWTGIPYVDAAIAQNRSKRVFVA